MIVKMKKIFIFVQEKDALGTLDNLRSLGVMHIEHQQLPSGDEINSLQSEITQTEQAISILENIPQSRLNSGKKSLSFDASRAMAGHIMLLQKRLIQLEEYTLGLKNKISQWQEWGDFEPDKIKELEKRNIFLRLYQIPLKEIDKLPASITVSVLSIKYGIANCAIVSYGKQDLGYRELGLPQQGLAELIKKTEEEKKVASQIRQEIEDSVPLLASLSSAKDTLLRELEFQKALKGMALSGAIMYFGGYVPKDNVADLENSARKYGWGILITEPKEEDEVPVLIRNPRWISIISPLFKFLEILPGYRELDISLPFLIFFSIFFGILIGDTGYGLVYFLISLFFHRKAAKNHKPTHFFFLFYILSACAMIWGLLTGTFFGHEWLMQAGFKPLMPALNDEKNMQRFCFFLGATHLSLAHIWQGILKLPSLKALADMGWICILWSAFFIARVLILGDVSPEFLRWLLIPGIVLVIFFTQPQKNIFKTIGNGLGTLALSIMNNFTDVVSYIRLFAVGMAGVAIADAFNAMAGMFGKGNILALAVGVLIALVGHTLGIVLGPVSVLVHGVRLNVLEFSGHANVFWSGVSYKPLKEV